MTIHREVRSSRALTWAPRRIQAPFSGMTEGKNEEEQGVGGNTHPPDLEGTKGADQPSSPHQGAGTMWKAGTERDSWPASELPAALRADSQAPCSCGVDTRVSQVQYHDSENTFTTPLSISHKKRLTISKRQWLAEAKSGMLADTVRSMFSHQTASSYPGESTPGTSLHISSFNEVRSFLMMRPRKYAT